MLVMNSDVQEILNASPVIVKFIEGTELFKVERLVDCHLDLDAQVPREFYELLGAGIKNVINEGFCLNTSERGYIVSFLISSAKMEDCNILSGILECLETFVSILEQTVGFGK